jgi:tRNA 2-thiouridine synthesizing protein A
MLIFAYAHIGVLMTDVDHVLDCQGMSCPLPIVKTAKAIKTIEVGQVLELLATDPGVEPDMQAWSRRTKNELLKIDKDGDVFHVFVRRMK